MALEDVLPTQIFSALEECVQSPGAPREEILQTGATLGVSFPEDYTALMMETNGVEFSLGDTCVVLFSHEDLVAENDLEPDEFPPYLKIFGSNGASEKFAFDTRTTPHPIVVVPHHMPDAEDILEQGPTLFGFLERVRKNEAFD